MKKLVKYLVVIIALALLVRWVGILDTIGQLKDISPKYTAMAVLLYILAQLVKAHRLGHVVKTLKHTIDWWKNIVGHFIAPVIGRLTPGKLGEAGKIFFVGADRKTAAFAHIIERALDALLLVILGSLLLFQLTIFASMYLIFAIVLFGVIIVAWHADKFVNWVLVRFLKKEGLPKNWFSSHVRMLSPVSWVALSLDTLLVWLLMFGAFYFLALGMNMQISFIALVAVMATSIIVGIVSGLPGGFGARELSTAFLLTQFGVSVEIAGLFAVTAIAFSLVVESVFALLGYLVYSLVWKKYSKGHK